jgi:hypothetical protein
MGKRAVHAAILLVASVVAVARFIAIDAGSHSASDTLRPWLIEVGVIGALAITAWVVVDRLAERR